LSDFKHLRNHGISPGRRASKDAPATSKLRVERLRCQIISISIWLEWALVYQRLPAKIRRSGSPAGGHWERLWYSGSSVPQTTTGPQINGLLRCPDTIGHLIYFDSGLRFGRGSFTVFTNGSAQKACAFDGVFGTNRFPC